MIFTIEEPFNTSELASLPTNLRIHANSYPEILLVRLLLGTANISHNELGSTIKQRQNFSIQPSQKNPRMRKKVIKDFLPANFELSDFDAYIVKNQYNNVNFLRNLLSEFCNFFYQTKYGSHTVAFLHLYRCLESVSYCFPLMYASSSRDYRGTFDTLQKFFKDSNSELKFFQLFVAKLFDGDLAPDVPLTLQVHGITPNVQEKYYKVLKKILPPNKILSETQYSSIDITYNELIGLTINLRNRYFHFLTGGQKNFSSVELPETDGFFRLINETIANWLSFIYFEIVRVGISRL